jgi:type II secretory pathway component GspD/PulD (secretin)
VTQREYTVPEARDLINRHLLARGYTLLQHGEVLSVVKIEKLNPGLVPRVEPEDLAKRLPHDYVKVSFPLDWLISERAVEELKPMLSPNAKLTPLKNTNRLEAIDAAINLREVYALLKREESDEPQQRLIKEFKLVHTRASDVIDQLKSLLGIESKPAAAPMSPQQMEMMQQQQQMMMQQMQARGGQGAGPPKKDEDVHLVAHKNSILAHAPPDKMQIIEQAIKAIDVESDQTQSLLSNINRMQVYRLHGVDPATLIKTLMDVGQLEPSTQLEADTKNKAIIAYGSLGDHLTIRQVIQRLDGSERKFEVVQLRRLEADYVAGTIEFMMVGPPQKQQQQSRYFFDYYSPYGRGGNETKETDQFRVDADTANNKLLLWANEPSWAKSQSAVETPRSCECSMVFRPNKCRSCSSGCNRRGHRWLPMS